MTAQENRASRFFIRCPHCEAQAKVRTSKQETRTMRSLICRCTNVLCNFTFVASFEAIQTISPSAMPHAEVNLPSSDYAIALLRKEALAAYKKPVQKEADTQRNSIKPIAAMQPQASSQAHLPQWHSLIHYTVTPKQERT
ncbi:ogr/Delta-like zinc finger family protein [Comamonas odontotermitis]|uniref:ogr/Delta-like zinc finger family protein n=1 Tax=Comamonas odontotermitis TaxID=379895 RepID=UPI0037533452